MDLTNYENLLNQHKDEFDIYYQELVSYNEKVNLTAITEKEEVYIKHFLDSILAVNKIKKNAKIVDVGTGAGFPSLPLKIVRPDLDLTMVDSLNKRINFLNLLTDKLKIKTSNIHSRAEDFCKNNRETFDVAVARAVARLNTLVEYLLPLVKIGGYIIAYKGVDKLELEESIFAINILGGKIEEIINFSLPNNKGERSLIVIKKIKSTPSKYPREKNLPKLKPLKTN